MAVENNQLTIGVAAAAYPFVRKLFDQVGIDYVMHGNLSIAEAAEFEGLDPNALIEAVAEIGRRSSAQWVDRSLRDLIQYLDVHHHGLSRELLFRTALRLSDCRAGTPNESVRTLGDEFTAFSTALISHMEYEEIVVFPMIRSIEGGSAQEASPRVRVDFIALHTALEKVLLDHNDLTERGRRIATLSADVEAAEGIPIACAEAVRSVRAIETHLRHFMNLENTILLPRALAFETPVA